MIKPAERKQNDRDCKKRWIFCEKVTRLLFGGWTAWAVRLNIFLKQSASWKNADIGFRSLQESIDTTTSGGRLIFHIFGALAEFERNLIRERTMAGLRAARARGRVGGRPRKLDAKKTALAYQLYDEKKYAVKEICQMLGVSKPTLYAYLARRDKDDNYRRWLYGSQLISPVSSS